MNKKSMLVTLIIRGFGALSDFLLAFVVARLFDSSIAGAFFLSLSLIRIGGMFFTTGAPNATIKLTAKYRDEQWSIIIGTLIWVSKRITIAIILSSIIILTLVYFLDKGLFGFDLKDFIYIFIGISLTSFYQLISYAILGLERTNIACLTQSCITPGIFLIIIICFNFTNINLNYLELIKIYISSTLINFIISIIIWCKIKVKSEKTTSVCNEFRHSLNSFWLMIMMEQSVSWSSQLLVGFLLSAHDVALFTVSQRLSMLVSFILIAINLIVAPRIAYFASKHDYVGVNRVTLDSGRIIFYISSSVFLGILIFGKILLGFFGTDYISAKALLNIFIIGQYVNACTGSVAYILNMSGHEKDMRNVVVFSGCLSILMSFIFTYYFGVIGAAVSSTLSIILQNLLAVYFVKLRLGFNTLNIFRKIY